MAHWALLSELTGHSFENCEIKSFEVQEGGIASLALPYTFKA